METVTISIPDNKSKLVKQILAGLGVTIQSSGKIDALNYKEKLLKIPTLTDEELKSFEEASKSFGDINPPQW